MEAHKFIVLPGSRVTIRDENNQEITVVVEQAFEAQATETVQVRVAQEDRLDSDGDSC